MLQTPLDGGPFCYAFSCHNVGFNHSTLYLYSEDELEPSKMLAGNMWLIRWRWTGLPIFMLPIAIAEAHDGYVLSRIEELNQDLRNIEAALLASNSSDVGNLDFGHLTQRLHALSTELSNLARRAHFQDTLLSTIRDTANVLHDVMAAEICSARLVGLEKAMQSRRYDLELMPKREQTARATVGNHPSR